MKNLLSATSLLAIVASAYAGVITVPTASLPLNTTNWNTSVLVPGFDPLIGNLDKVVIVYKGTVFGTIRGESFDTSPSTIQLNLSSTITFTAPNSAQTQVFPLADETFNATAHDGVFDYGGTSGVTFSDLTDTDTTTEVLTTNLSAFLTTGNVSFGVNAAGTSSGSGGGNLVFNAATAASAMFDVEYHYSDFTVIPEPSEIISVVAIALTTGVVMLRLRRK